MNSVIKPFDLASSSNFQRVRKADAPANAFAQPDALETCLECWKTWMAADPDRDLGMKTMGGLMGEGDGHGMDPHEAQQAADHRIGAATDAMIESLTRIHKWAIYTSCSVSTAWRFPNADLMVTAQEARVELTKKLKSNVCTAVLF